MALIACRMHQARAHTARIAPPICPPSSDVNCRGGNENSCTTVTVHAASHWMICCGSATEQRNQESEGSSGCDVAELAHKGADEIASEPVHRAIRQDG